MRYVLSSFKGERKRGLEGCMEDAIYMFRSLYILNKEIFNWTANYIVFNYATVK